MLTTLSGSVWPAKKALLTLKKVHFRPRNGLFHTTIKPIPQHRKRSAEP